MIAREGPFLEAKFGDDYHTFEQRTRRQISALLRPILQRLLAVFHHLHGDMLA